MEKTKQIYPKPVIEVIDQVMDLLEHNPDGINFFTSEDISKGYEDYAKIIMYNLIGDYLLPKFLIGGEDELVFETEEDFDELLKSCIVDVALKHLIDNKLVNYIEDEHGEEVFFLTNEGIEYTEKRIFNTEDKNVD